MANVSWRETAHALRRLCVNQRKLFGIPELPAFASGTTLNGLRLGLGSVALHPMPLTPLWGHASHNRNVGHEDRAVCWSQRCERCLSAFHRGGDGNHAD